MRRAIGLVTWLGVLALGCDEGFAIGDLDGSAPDEDAAVADAGDGGTGADPDAGDGGGDVDAGVDAAAPDAGEPDAGGGPAGPAADELPLLYAEATCDALLDCLGTTLLVDQLAGRDCVVFYRNRFADGDLRDVPASIEAGLVDYHPEQVDACLDDLGALGCDVRASRLPPSCEDAVTGTVAIGGDCAINEDCEGDAFCDRGEPAMCPGTCAAPRSAGTACDLNDDAQCADGLVCTGGSCEALGTGGDACGSGLPGCMPGTVCFDTGSGDECTMTTDLYTELDGDACDVSSGPLCQPPLVCESVSGTSGTCAAKVGLDASCKRSVPNQCAISQYCDASTAGTTGTCVDYPMDGDACLNRSQQCADEHVCVASVCRPLGILGDGCEADAQCYSGACYGSGECVARADCDAP